jgi:hypothetical protein
MNHHHNSCIDVTKEKLHVLLPIETRLHIIIAKYIFSSNETSVINKSTSPKDQNCLNVYNLHIFFSPQ